MWQPINLNEILRTCEERMFYNPGDWEFKIWPSLSTLKQLFEVIQYCL